MANFSTWIPDCDSYSPALLDLFLSSDASICCTMAFLPLGNSDHVVVSVSIDFPSNSQQDTPFHHIACDYSCADWDCLCNHLRMDWGSYIISITKTDSKKTKALIHYIKCFSPVVALYLYKSTIHPCMEYCCHVWAGAPSCHLQWLDKLQKQICRTVGSSLVTSLEPLAYHQNVTWLILFYSLKSLIW